MSDGYKAAIIMLSYGDKTADELSRGTIYGPDFIIGFRKFLKYDGRILYSKPFRGREVVYSLEEKVGFRPAGRKARVGYERCDPLIADSSTGLTQK